MNAAIALYVAAYLLLANGSTVTLSGNSSSARHTLELPCLTLQAGMPIEKSQHISLHASDDAARHTSIRHHQARPHDPNTGNANMHTAKEELINGKVAEQRIWLRAKPEFISGYIKESLRHEIINRLSRYRQEQGLSQAELATLSATTQPMLSRFLSGEDRRSPNLETLIKVAWALNKEIRIEFIERLSDVPSKPQESGAANLRDCLINSIKAPLPEKTASVISRHARLEHTSLLRCEFQTHSRCIARGGVELSITSVESCSTEYNVEHVLEPSRGEDKHLRIRVDFRSQAFSDKSISLVNLKATVEMLYSLVEDTPQDVLASIDCFARSHAVLAAVPQYRRAVDILTASLG